MTNISRRRLLAATAGAIAASPFLVSSLVHAKDNRIVVTSLGGLWERSIRRDFIPLFKKRTGADVDIVLGGPSQWMSQIESQPGKPPLDTIDNSETLAYQLMAQDMAVKLTEDKVPNLADIPPIFRAPWDDYAAMYMYSAAGFFYNKEKIKDPPKSWVEFFERAGKGEFGKSLSLPDISYGWGNAFIWAYAAAHGGGIDNIELGFDAIERVKPYVVKFWANSGEVERLITSREVDIGVFWDGRIHSLIEGGADYLGFQRMDSHVLISGMASQVVKNGNEALALEFLNTLLDPVPQLRFHETINYAVTNAKVQYPEARKNQILPASEGIIPPYRELAQLTPGMIQTWNQKIRT